MNYTGDIIRTNANAGFMLEDKFIEAYSKCVEADRGRLLLPDSSYDIRWRIHTLLWAAKYAEKLEGDFVECGVGFGLFASAIFSYLKFEELPKNYYLIDTFEGLSEKYSSKEELKRTGKYYTKNNPWHEEVVNRFSNFRNAKIIKGEVPDVLKTLDIDKVSFISIDMNTTIPESEALEFFWPKLVSGVIIVFDDYGFPGHENQKKSHDSFAASKNLLIYTSPTGQGILIKP